MWYIGQPVVVIKDHSLGTFKKGQEFTIHGIKNSFCRCNENIINVGISTRHIHISCKYCGIKRLNDGFYSEKLFAPLDQDISELTEILNQKSKQNEKAQK